MSKKKIAVVKADGRIVCSRRVGSSTRSWGWNPEPAGSSDCSHKKPSPKPALTIKLIKATKSSL